MGRGKSVPLQNQTVDFNLSSSGQLTDVKTMGEVSLQSPLTTVQQVVNIA